MILAKNFMSLHIKVYFCFVSYMLDFHITKHLAGSTVAMDSVWGTLLLPAFSRSPDHRVCHWWHYERERTFTIIPLQRHIQHAGLHAQQLQCAPCFLSQSFSKKLTSDHPRRESIPVSWIPSTPVQECYISRKTLVREIYLGVEPVTGYYHRGWQNTKDTTQNEADLHSLCSKATGVWKSDISRK